MSGLELFAVITTIIGAVSLFYWRLYVVINNNRNHVDSSNREIWEEIKGIDRKYEQKGQQAIDRIGSLRHEMSDEYLKRTEFYQALEANKQDLHRQFEHIRRDINAMNGKMDGLVTTIVKMVGKNV